VLAPTRARAVRAGRGRRRRCRLRPVAGTFALVRTTDIALRFWSAQADGLRQPVVAAAPEAAPPATVAPEVVVADNRLIRDTRLDRYLAAHKQFAGSSALGVPSVFLRSATVDSTSAR
jgi:sigma-E factor negative regulatory protein RseA